MFEAGRDLTDVDVLALAKCLRQVGTRQVLMFEAGRD